MTNKEAIRILTLERDDWETSHCSPMVRKEAFEMAINALEAQEKAQEVSKDSQKVDRKNGELIRRKAAIEALNKEIIKRRLLDDVNDGMLDEFDTEDILRKLPSAQPETAKRIVGKSRDGMTLWYQCDMCNEPVDVQDNFCRGCGRRLTDERFDPKTGCD